MFSLRTNAKRFFSFCLLAGFAFLSSCKKPTPTLSLLVWEGYADTSFIQGFEAICHCKVVAAYMGSSDELVAKLRGGAASNYDVISPSSDVATMLARSGPGGAAGPDEDPELFPGFSHADQYAAGEKQRTGLRRSAHLGTESPAVRQDCVPAKDRPPGPSSGTRSTRNKLSLWDDLSSVYMAAQVLGFGRQDPDGDLQPQRRPTRTGESQADHA